MKKVDEMTLIESKSFSRAKLHLGLMLLGVLFFAFSALALKSSAESAMWEIGTKEKLFEFREKIYSGEIPSSTDVILTADIDMGGALWKPIILSGDATRLGNNYSGTFDGNGHVIYGINMGDIEITAMEGTGSFTGFVFSLGKEGVIKNLTLSGKAANSKKRDEVGIGVFAVNSYGTIENCVNLCSVTIHDTPKSRKTIGGIALGNFGSIRSCVNNGEISVASTEVMDGFTGGIAADNKGDISMCVNRADIKGANITGGIAGNLSGRAVISCVNTGSVSTQKEEMATGGGIIGSCAGNANTFNCMNMGSVEASRAGGIAGDSKGAITACTNKGKVHAYRSEVENGQNSAGGIAGVTENTTLKANTNTGEVTAEINLPETKYKGAGGLVGHLGFNSTINNCGFAKEAAVPYHTKENNSEIQIGVISADADKLNAKAVTTISVAPSIRLQPGGTGSFEIKVNGRAVTLEEIETYAVSAAKISETGREFAAIEAFTKGIAPAEANSKDFGVGSAAFNFRFKTTEFQYFNAADNPIAGSEAVSFDASLFVNVGNAIKPVTPESGGSGGGCNAGLASLALLAAIPFIVRRKK